MVHINTANRIDAYKGVTSNNDTEAVICNLCFKKTITTSAQFGNFSFRPTLFISIFLRKESPRLICLLLAASPSLPFCIPRSC